MTNISAPPSPRAAASSAGFGLNWPCSLLLAPCSSFQCLRRSAGPGRVPHTMDGLSLAILLVLGCPGDVGKLKPAPAALPALHPLRRRPNTRRPRTDAPHFTTSTTPTPLLTTTTAPGALLLSSYLLVHLLLPRMRLLNNMDPSAENTVCLLLALGRARLGEIGLGPMPCDGKGSRLLTTHPAARRPSARDSGRPRSAPPPRPSSRRSHPR